MEFSDKIWRLIFNQLNFETLKNCLLLSDDLRELIIHTPRLMKKVKVILWRETWREKIPFLQKYGACIRSLQFAHCNVRHHRPVTNTLKLTPNIEELVCSNFLHWMPEDDEDILESLSSCFHQ